MEWVVCFHPEIMPGRRPPTPYWGPGHKVKVSQEGGWRCCHKVGVCVCVSACVYSRGQPRYHLPHVFQIKILPSIWLNKFFYLPLLTFSSFPLWWEFSFVMGEGCWLISHFFFFFNTRKSQFTPSNYQEGFNALNEVITSEPAWSPPLYYHPWGGESGQGGVTSSRKVLRHKLPKAFKGKRELNKKYEHPYK